MASVDVNFESNVLYLIANKLGFVDEVNKLIMKAGELLRLLDLKSGNCAGLLTLNDTCRVVMCLDLAAEFLGVSLDRPEAIKLSGIKKKAYLNGLYNIEKILGLEKQLTISDLAVQLECSEVSQFAQNLLKRFLTSTGKTGKKHMTIDLGHPMYPCAAVLAACRLRKVKVKRVRITELSHIRPAALDGLVDQMMKCAVQSEVKTDGRKFRKRNFVDLVEELVTESEKTPLAKDSEYGEADNEDDMESYAQWKKRILLESGQ